MNNSATVIKTVEKFAQMVKAAGILFHVDCVQSFCKLPVDHFASEVDAITVSAHKIGGPKGCGAVYINPKLNVLPLTPGVTHERGLRGGTVDTPAVVAFAVAVESYTYDEAHYKVLRETLVQNLPNSYKFVACDPQLPTICGFFTEKYEGQYVLLKLNEVGICISTGSACDIHSESGTKAVIAMGYSIDEARKFFRISFGPQTTNEQINILVSALKGI